MSEECKHARAVNVVEHVSWCVDCGGLRVSGLLVGPDKHGTRQLPKYLRLQTKYVIRSHDSQWWLTKGGLQEYAPPPRAMVFDTQLEAEQNLADYRRDSPGAIAIHVETIGV